LKPPGSKRSKLKCDVLLSNFGFQLNLRRYTKVVIQYGGSVKAGSVDELMQCPDVDGCLVAGAYTRSLLSST
jgi:triosephosphate isomerase